MPTGKESDLVFFSDFIASHFINLVVPKLLLKSNSLLRCCGMSWGRNNLNVVDTVVHLFVSLQPALAESRLMYSALLYQPCCKFWTDTGQAGIPGEVGHGACVTEFIVILCCQCSKANSYQRGSKSGRRLIDASKESHITWGRLQGSKFHFE